MYLQYLKTWEGCYCWDLPALSLLVTIRLEYGQSEVHEYFKIHLFEVWNLADCFKIKFTLISSLQCYFSILRNVLCEHNTADPDLQRVNWSSETLSSTSNVFVLHFILMEKDERVIFSRKPFWGLDNVWIK